MPFLEVSRPLGRETITLRGARSSRHARLLAAHGGAFRQSLALARWRAFGARRRPLRRRRWWWRRRRWRLHLRWWRRRRCLGRWWRRRSLHDRSLGRRNRLYLLLGRPLLEVGRRSLLH